MRLIYYIVKQDLKLACRKGGGVRTMWAIYLVVSALFVFNAGFIPKNIIFVTTAAVWVCALLVQGIAAYRIFADDYKDGTLEQLILLGDMPIKIVVARAVSNWCVGGVLLIIFAAVIATLSGLEWSVIKTLLTSLVIGTPLLSMISVTAHYLFMR
jgi:heme exporter protein B